MCLIDINKLFEKYMIFETCLLFMLYVEYGFTNKKNIHLHKAPIFVHAHVD